VSVCVGRNVEGRMALEWGRADGRPFLGVPLFGGRMGYVLVGSPRP
jgi:hypothetical protein